MAREDCEREAESAEAAGSEGAGARGERPRPTDPLVLRALDLFEREPERRWTVEEIAERLATSRPTLGRRFVEALGVPPLSALREVRLRLAARRLTETTESLGEIADRVGYESEFALSRAFTRHYGVRPGAFRRGARAGQILALAA